MQKAAVPLPTLPTLPVATASKPPVLSSKKLYHMKDAICLILLDDELTRKDKVHTSRLTHLSVEQQLMDK
jgi:hypothetical protein